jgi:hypothetical protein
MKSIDLCTLLALALSGLGLQACEGQRKERCD